MTSSRIPQYRDPGSSSRSDESVRRKSTGISNWRQLVVRVLFGAVAVSAAAIPASAGAVAPTRHAAAIKHGGTVVVSQSPSGSWTQNFNPWAAGVTQGTGMMWEPLLWFNLLKGGKASPWLAKSYKWSNHNRNLTFNLRKGVKWNDGKAFTSKDVLFSYRMAVKYPDFTYCSCTQVVRNVTAPNASTVVFHLNRVDSSMVYWIGSAEPIPQHAYSGQGDPAKIQIKNPVSTGPFMLGSFSPQVFVLKRNPHYWQAGKPYVNALRYPAYSSNDSDQLALVKGVGSIAGYVGGWLDDVLTLIMNVFLTIPSLPLVIVAASYAAAFNVRGLGVIIVVLTATGWAWGARVKRSQILSLRNRDFVMAAKVSGENWLRILVTEVLPNMTSLIASAFIFGVIFAVLAEAGLEFIGLGDLNATTWGTMLYWSENNSALLTGMWWWFIPPGIAIGLFALSLTLIQYVLDEMTNPRLRNPNRRKGSMPVAMLSPAGPIIETDLETSSDANFA